MSVSDIEHAFDQTCRCYKAYTWIFPYKNKTREHTNTKFNL